MKIAGEYVFDGPREGVWELFRDPDVLVTALPGAQSIEQVGENEYVGNMHVRVGPVSGVFSGRIVISNEVPPESYTMTVEGKGKAAFVKASGDVQLTDQGDDTTLMKYGGEFQVGGRLVSVGQRLIDSVSKKMLRQGLDTLNETLKERVAAESAGQESVEYKPPSEAKFAAAVAKDMAGEMLSSSQMIWIAVAVAIVTVIVAVILTSRAGG